MISIAQFMNAPIIVALCVWFGILMLCSVFGLVFYYSCSISQEPGSVHLSTLKDSTQAWLTDRKIKVRRSNEGGFVRIVCFRDSTQSPRAITLRRGLSPVSHWLGWAS